MIGKKKASIFTMIVSILNSFIAVIFSLVYNNYVIMIYGSSVNGLVSTLTQFVSFFSIIEGGFTTAAVVAIYRPIVKNDYSKLNDILYTVKRAYIKMGIIITISVLMCGLFYIRLLDSPLSLSQTYLLLIISVLTTALSLCFCAKYSVLLQGDNKEYVQVILSLVCRTITWILSMIMILRNSNILVVYSVNIINVIFNILLMKKYEHRNYKQVSYRGDYHKEYIKGTSDVLFQKIANTVFSSTDLVLISVFINLSYASVYNLYYQIYRAILTLLTAVAQAPFNSFGHIFNSDNGKERISELFQIYQHIMLLISTIVLSVACTVIIPFVRLYTERITDFEYVYPLLALMFFAQVFVQIINRPYGIILNVTGNFRMQNVQCAISVIVNIVVSMAFINVWGIYSIILGSFLATLVILFMNVQQAYKYVLKLSAIKPVMNIIINFLVAIGIILLSLKADIRCRNYLELTFLTILCTLIVILILLLANLLIDYKKTIGAIVFIKTFFVRE